MRTTHLFLLALVLGSTALGLGGTTELLAAVLALLACIDILANLVFVQPANTSIDSMNFVENVRCCLLARSFLAAMPTRTSL